MINFAEKIKETNNNSNLKEEITMFKIEVATKDEIRTKLEEMGIVMSNVVFKKTKRDALVTKYNESLIIPVVIKTPAAYDSMGHTEMDLLSDEELRGAILQEYRVCRSTICPGVDIMEHSELVEFLYAVTSGLFSINSLYNICCGTGRRPKDLYGYTKDNYKVMIEKMKKAVIWFYETKNVRKFITGGAQGWDQLLFWAVNAVKRDNNYTDIQNVVYFPFKGQELKWSTDGLFGQKEYQLMLKMADDVRYVTENVVSTNYKQVVDAMMDRNHAMVNDSNYVFGCFPDDTWFQPATKSGTAECLRYAYKKRIDTTIMYHNTGVSKFYEFSKVAK